jgi:hypothetical protein
MLLVLCSVFDELVPSGVALWRAQGATVEILTCHDLAQPGWKLTLDGDPTLVVAGKPVAAKDVTAVVTRLAGVSTSELPFMHPEDREYAASEMQAFLLALLTMLRCPVLNRPHAGSLCGPPWSPERWTICAARAGVPVRPAVRHAHAGGVAVDGHAPPDRRVVHVVGGVVVGDAPPALAKAAVAIARSAGTDLLRVAFDAIAGIHAPMFLDADPWVDISDKSVAEAIRDKVAA